jgi:hypothetical protein
LEISPIKQGKNQLNYENIIACLETTTEFLENLKELENNLLVLYKFFETEIHFLPEK